MTGEGFTWEAMYADIRAEGRQDGQGRQGNVTVQGCQVIADGHRCPNPAEVMIEAACVHEHAEQLPACQGCVGWIRADHEGFGSWCRSCAEHAEHGHACELTIVFRPLALRGAS